MNYLVASRQVLGALLIGLGLIAQPLIVATNLPVHFNEQGNYLPSSKYDVAQQRDEPLQIKNLSSSFSKMEIALAKSLGLEIKKSQRTRKSESQIGVDMVRKAL